MEKTCITCKETKEITHFEPTKSSKDGRRGQCHYCVLQGRLKKNPNYYTDVRRYGKEHYEDIKKRDPERYEQYLKDKVEYRTKHKTHYMWLAARKRAREANIPFNIEESDIIIPEYCPLLEIPIRLYEDQKNFNGPSLDKIFPELGYIKGNVRVISRKANMLKFNCSEEELLKFSKNIIKYLKDV